MATTRQTTPTQLPAAGLPVPTLLQADAIFDLVGQGLLLLDDLGRIVSANATAAEMLGRPVDLLLGRTTTLPFVPPSRLEQPELGWNDSGSATDEVTRAANGTALNSGVPEAPVNGRKRGRRAAADGRQNRKVDGRQDPAGTGVFLDPPATLGGASLASPQGRQGTSVLPPQGMLKGNTAAGARDAGVTTHLLSPVTMTPPSGVPSITSGGAHRRLVAVPVPAGFTRWLSVSASQLSAEEFGTRGWVVNLIDASDAAPLHGDRDGAELRLRGALRAAGMATWERQLSRDTWTWSVEMFALLGLESGEPPGYQEWLSWMPPDDRERLSRAEQEGVAAGRGWHATFRVRLPSGQTRHLKVWCEPVFNDTGRPLTVLGTTVDVTDSEEAAEQLRMAGLRLGAAIHLTGLASWTMTLDTGEQWWSESMYSLYGRDREAGAPSASQHLEMVLEQDRDELLSTFATVLETGEPAEVTLRITPVGASIRHLRCWIDVTSDGTKRARTLWGTALDITDEEQNLAQLEASREELRLAFEMAPTGMVLLDVELDGRPRLLRINHALTELLALPQHCSYDELEACFHPEDLDLVRERMGRMARGEVQETSYDVRLVRSDGTTIHVWVHAAAAKPGAESGVHVVYHVLDVTQRFINQRELRRLALTDATTGLANRARLEQRLGDALARVRPRHRGVALLLLDLDRFKSVNDSFGHLAGDALLVEIGRRLSAVAPPGAEVARLGGDEFAIVVDPSPSDSALSGLAQAVRESLSRPFKLPDGATIVTTCSIGITHCDERGRTVEDLYREADLALYAAKDAGRDTQALYDLRLRAEADTRIEAERMLRAGLANDGLVVRMQPVVDLRGGAVAGAEVLARIDDPRQGLLDPSAFIDVAEDTGLVVDVDLRVAGLAIAHLAGPNAVPGRWLAVNVSARTLENENYLSSLEQMLRQHRVHPSQLLVEVTEHSLLDPTGARARGLNGLRDLGVRVGIDDFGTGYSALAYLDRFQLDFLKIDRSFVTRLGTGSRPDAVVSAIISLAHAHGLAVTAEGVETPGQARVLRTMGCDRAQGYLFGRPGTP